MKATITGNDSLSKRILLDLERRLKVSEVPDHYPVSLDQTKRLSRYRNMLQLAEGHLSDDQFKRLNWLGLKALPLSKMFRSSDWEGITDVLKSVTDETTREELELLIKALEEKRERIRTLKENISLQMDDLEAKEQFLQYEKKKIQNSDLLSSVWGGLKEVQDEIEEVQFSLMSLENKKMNSYKQLSGMLEAPLSVDELKLHKRLQEKASEWLFKRGFVVVEGLDLQNGKKADIMAYNESTVVIVDVKVSLADLKGSHDMVDYFQYCHEFYVLTDKDLYEEAVKHLDGDQCGLLVETDQGIRMKSEDKRLNVKVEQEDELRFAVARLLSKKNIYGY